MTINQQTFYRTHGIRNINELASPRLFELRQFNFPTRSLLHYATYDSIQNGPAGDYSLFNEIAKPILFKTVNEIVAFNGSPRLQPLNEGELVRDYRNNNRRMKLLTSDVSAVMDPATLVVMNYCLLNKKYRYARNIFTDYHRWKNIFTTVVDTFIVNTDNAQVAHYTALSIPEVIPSLNQLDRANLNLDQSILKVFKDDSSFTLLELWKWLDPKSSATSIFNRIPINKLHLLNLIYVKRNKWCVLNLGVLNSFRNQTSADLKAENMPVVLSKVKLDFRQIQKRLLKLMMTLESGSITVVDTEEDLKIVAADEMSPELDEEGQVIEQATPVIKEKPLTDEELLRKQEKAQQLLVIDEDDDQDVIREKIKLQDMELDQELEQLNDIGERRENEEQTEDNATIYDFLNEQEPELDKLVMAMCDRLADNNLLSAGEYKRFLKLSGSYKTIVAKDGKSTLNEYVKISPDELRVDDVQNIPDSAAIIDKTMLHASMQVFDSNYIKKDIIGRDTAAMVLSMQKAGLIITDYKVETYESILGAEEDHTVRIVPVEGAPSTIRFKVPVINENGTFTSNGVKYRSRKQMGD